MADTAMADLDEDILRAGIAAFKGERSDRRCCGLGRVSFGREHGCVLVYGKAIGKRQL
jgi:hypothetical protein